MPETIDPRAPRFNQAVLTVGLLGGFVLDVPALIPVFALMLFLGAAFGPAYGPALRFFKEIVRPRLGPPAFMEDPRPPRFSATVGVAFLGAASLALVAGAPGLAWGLSLVVAALAGLAATTGICVGCEIYLLFARRFGVEIEVGAPMTRIQILALLLMLIGVANVLYRRRLAGLQTTGSTEVLPAELRGPGSTWVVFTTPTCVTCGSVLDFLRRSESGATITAVDATERADLSDALSVRAAPTVLRADQDGVIDLRLAGPAAASEFFSLRTA